MALKKISLENFTVFDQIEIEFCDGINVFIGENGTGENTYYEIALQCLSGSASKNNRY